MDWFGLNEIGEGRWVFGRSDSQDYYLPKFKKDHEKIVVGSWKTSFLLGRPIFRGYGKLREGIYIYIYVKLVFFWVRGVRTKPAFGQ